MTVRYPLLGIYLKHTSVEAISVIGCLVFPGYVLALYVKGPAGAVAILVLGAVLVTLAIRAELHHKGPPPGPGRQARHPSLPIEPYLRRRQIMEHDGTFTASRDQ